MSKHRVDSFIVGEDKSESYFGVTVLKSFREFFPDIKARKAIVGESYVMEGGFFFLNGFGRRGDCFV